MTDNHRSSAHSASERKQKALRGYDAWVTADLGQRRGRLIYAWIGAAVAATLVIGAVLTMQGSGEGDDSRQEKVAREEKSANDPAGKPVAAKGVKEQVVNLVRQIPIEQHIEVSRAVGANLADRLLTPAQKWMARKPAGARSGVNRILNRGPFEGLISIRGGGAYFSFSTRSNSYDDSPQLSIEWWKFRTGFAGGDCGLVEPVKVQSVDNVSLSTFPAYFTQPARKFYPWLRQQRVEPASAAVGTVYLVRAIQWRETDVLAAFEVLEKDNYGVTIAWKVLQTQPAPARR